MTGAAGDGHHRLEGRLNGWDDAEETGIVIVGSGFGGLGMAIRLLQSGVRDFVVLERAGDVGGTWRDNTYPGCACDVQSHLYSFSFLPNPDWSRSFSPGWEIQEYLQRCAREQDVLPHVRFDHELTAATWDEPAQHWRIEAGGKRFTCWVLVMAAGALSDPRLPELSGLETFRGAKFHSARWDHEVPLDGRRIAVVGTGSSAVQFVPQIQPRVQRLHVFQRTAPWVLPHTDRPLGPRRRGVYRRLPVALRAVRGAIYAAREGMVLGFRHPRVMRLAERVALRHLRRSVADPALRAKLVPDFTLGCKRVLLSNDYFPALTRPNVELVTERIARVEPDAVITADGVRRPVDVIIFGTGFRATDPPWAPHVRGRDGRSLAEVWAGSPQAHLGITVSGFPNFFMLMGPNTGLGHSSVVYMIEAQIEHVLGALAWLRARGGGAVEPRREAQAAYVSRLEERMGGTVWTSGGCASWYLDGTGRNSTLWPDFTWRFRRRVARFRPEEYEVAGGGGRSTDV